MELAGKESVITSPGETKSSTQELDGTATIDYLKTDRAGSYELSIADPPTVLQFAAQPDPRESRLEMLSDQQQERIAQHASLIKFTPTTELREVLSRERKGAELWILLLVAVITLAIIEMTLAQWFSREK